jgi:hypothetical protein
LPLTRPRVPRDFGGDGVDITATTAALKNLSSVS